MILRLLPVFLLFFQAAYSYGQSQNYVFNRLAIGDGLLSNNVKTVWQDPTGYLWIGSAGGLQRYDGANMRTVLYDRVDQILADAAGRVWLRSGTRVGIFNTQTFSVAYVPYESADAVFNPNRIWLRKDAAGKVFLILTGKSCQYYDEKKQFFSRANNPFRLPGSLLVTDVVDDPAGNRYWVLAQNGFGYWDKKTKLYYSSADNPLNDPLLANPSTPAVVSRLYIDRENHIWMVEAVSPKVRFLCFDTSKKRYTADTAGLNNPESGYFEVYGFSGYQDSITVVYGLNYFRTRQGRSYSNRKTSITDPYGIQFNSIAGVVQDREGILWIATDNGLYYTSDTRRKQLRIVLSQEKQRGAISSFLEDNGQSLWIGTWGRGAFSINRNARGSGPVPLRGLARPDGATQWIWSLCADDRQDIWVGCDQGLLARYSPGKKKTEFYRPAAFANSAVRQVLKAPGGRLWVGLQNGTVFCFNPSEKFSEDSLRQVFSLGGAVNRMVLVNKDQLWIAVNGKGIVTADIRAGKIIQTADVRKTGSVLIAGIRDILPVNDTLFLVAGEKLGALNPFTFRADFNYPPNGRLAGTVHTLQKDRFNEVWIGSSEGISKLSPSTGMVTRYSQQDGLVTVHNNSYVPERSLGLSDGCLAFGGNQHMIVFDPGEYRASVRPPNVTITGFLLNDRYLRADSLARLATVTVPYTHSTLGIDFAAISFSQRERLTYEYKLEGQDNAWIPLTSAPRVRYNSLPHGRYRFLVRAKNEQGMYAPTVTSLNLKVQPPFWKTVWFYALVILVMAAILFYLHRLRLEKLLHVEKVRNRLARDLHDDMGSTLSTINILSNMALLQETPDPDKNRQYLDTIRRSTQQMMEAMDDIVWSINPVNDTMAKVLARMKETAGAILEPAQIDYRFEVGAGVPDLHLSMEARRELFLIFKEALNNIVKYANCSMVLFSLSKKGADLELDIGDNGTGFHVPAPQTATRGNGLRNMQSRAAGAGGKLTVTSAPAKGTRITLLIPVA